VQHRCFVADHFDYASLATEVLEIVLASPVRLPDHFSEAAKRRSRCGSVRGSPVLNSHFSPGLAPQVGQRTAKAGTCLIFTAA